MLSSAQLKAVDVSTPHTEFPLPPPPTFKPAAHSAPRARKRINSTSTVSARTQVDTNHPRSWRHYTQHSCFLELGLLPIADVGSSKREAAAETAGFDC